MLDPPCVRDAQSRRVSRLPRTCRCRDALPHQSHAIRISDSPKVLLEQSRIRYSHIDAIERLDHVGDPVGIVGEDRRYEPRSFFTSHSRKNTADADRDYHVRSETPDRSRDCRDSSRFGADSSVHDLCAETRMGSGIDVRIVVARSACQPGRYIPPSVEHPSAKTVYPSLHAAPQTVRLRYEHEPFHVRQSRVQSSCGAIFPARPSIAATLFCSVTVNERMFSCDESQPPNGCVTEIR